MNWLIIVATLIIGFVSGIAVSFFVKIIQARTAKELAGELFRENESCRKANIDEIINNVKASFGSLSLEALSKSTEEFLKLAKATLETERELGVKNLDTKKGLIDQQLGQMTSKLEKVSALIKELENDRIEKFGQLTGQLKAACEQTSALTQTTNSLRQALVSTKARGQWGERMAEDVLRIAGFIENINYLKQRTIEGIGSRPDFTFLLPRNLKMNMDVKFPLDNYIKFTEAKTDLEKEKHRADFLRDVRLKIKEVTSRDYINPGQNTVDYVLLFIPNEQIYAFIHEQDSSILEEGIRHKVIFCSPVTFFAVLAVIRQAIDNFALEETSNEMLSLFGLFRKQWAEFIKKLEILGRRIEDVHNEYEALSTTRRKQLERPLNKIEDLRLQRGLPVPANDEASVDPAITREPVEKLSQIDGYA